MRCKKCNVEHDQDVCPTCGKNLSELANDGLLEDIKTNESSVETFSDSNSSQEVFSISEEKPTNNIETFDMGVGQQQPKKKSIVSVIGVLAAVVLILGVGYLVYMKFRPKLAFQSIINQTIKTFEKGMGIDYDTIKTDFDIKLKVDGDDEYAEYFDILNKFSINVSVEADYKKNKSFMKLNSTYDKEDFLSFDMFYEDKDVYMLLNELFDKYIKYDFDGELLEKPLVEDYKIVVDSFVRELKKSLRLEYFTKKNSDGFEVSTLELTEKQLNDMALELLKGLKKDDKFIEAISNITKMEEDEFVDRLDRDIDALEESTASDEIAITIKLYTKMFSNDVVKAEIEIEGISYLIEVESEEKISITMDSDGVVYKCEVATKKDGDKDIVILSMSGKGMNIEIQFSCSVKYGVDIIDPDVSNYVDYDKLSEEDSERIVDNLLKSKGVTNFLEDTGLGALMFGMSGGMTASLDKSFQVYGERIISAAMNAYESDLLLNNTSHKKGDLYYYILEDLSVSTSSYRGLVVANTQNAKNEYLLYLTDGERSYVGVNGDELYNSVAVIKYDMESVNSVNSAIENAGNY